MGGGVTLQYVPPLSWSCPMFTPMVGVVPLFAESTVSASCMSRAGGLEWGQQNWQGAQCMARSGGLERQRLAVLNWLF